MYFCHRILRPIESGAEDEISVVVSCEISLETEKASYLTVTSDNKRFRGPDAARGPKFDHSDIKFDCKTRDWRC